MYIKFFSIEYNCTARFMVFCWFRPYFCTEFMRSLCFLYIRSIPAKNYSYRSKFRYIPHITIPPTFAIFYQYCLKLRVAMGTTSCEIQAYVYPHLTIPTYVRHFHDVRYIFNRIILFLYLELVTVTALAGR